MEPKTAVLLIAHGSRERRANEELRELADRLSEHLGETPVFPCFLELEDPTIPQAFENAVHAGARSIVAFPFFLSSGVHVKKDIPEILMDCLQKFPEIAVELTAALGPDPSLDCIALERVRSGGLPIPPRVEDQ